MNMPSQHLEAIQSYGYTRTEAEFLYLVATHSGYFTQSHFLRYAGVAKGGAASRFTEKVLRLGHARTTRYAYGTLVFNLYSRLIYGAINKDNLRNRRRLSHDLVRTRLFIFDFVLGHLEHHYLETEADKLRYFCDKLQIPSPALPGRIYRGIRTDSNRKRYFVDRFPIFIPCGSESLFVPLAPTFVYCDGPEPSLLRFIGHLRAYESLLRSLPAFSLVYAAPNEIKFQRATKFFCRVFHQTNNLNPDRLIRYFRVRQAWEEHKTNTLTRADRQLLRSGDQHFRGETFDNAYHRWAGAQLSNAELKAILRTASASENRRFSTCILSSPYDIFERLSKSTSGTTLLDRGSKSGSSLASPPVPPNSLELH